MIEAPYISAVAALVGTIAGCVTSIMTSWFASRSQSAIKRLEHEINSKHLLYDKFIDEASKVYIHALEHDSTEVSKLINLYATLNEIRVVSSSAVSLEAEKAVRTIIATYSRDNKTFVELLKLMDQGFPDPLQAFSEACRQELRTL